MERRHPQHRQLPQRHRDPHRDDRQPDADADPLRPGAAAAVPRHAVSDRAAGVALPPVDRVFDVVQPGGDRLRLAQPRTPAVQHLQDGPARDPARQRGHVDAVTVPDQRDQRRRSERVGVAAHAGAARSARLHHSLQPAGLPHGDQIHQRAAGSERDGAPCDKRLPRPREGLPGRVIRRVHRAGVPSARPGHVRAAGPSERDSVSRRAAYAAL